MSFAATTAADGTRQGGSIDEATVSSSRNNHTRSSSQQLSFADAASYSSSSGSPVYGIQPSSTTSTLPRPPRRRIRPKIALDPDQPLTAQGRPRARVYLACNQCRARKTRCDGARPICFHCRKRPPEEGGSCSYESLPKRRGDDQPPRTPRHSREPSGKRRRTLNGEASTPSRSNSFGSSRSISPDRLTSVHFDDFQELFDAAYDESSSDNDPFAIDFDELLNLHNLNLGTHTSEASQSIPPRPSLQFTRDTWWDALLTFYSCESDMQALSPITLSAEQRSGAMVKIVSDLRSFFFSSFYWLSFINIPRFFDDVFDTTRRAQLQPSLLLSALAVGTLAQSSDADNGAPGRARALRLLELADGALQASLAAGWVDIGLVKAAWLIVYFEMQVHPLKSVERDRSSLLLLDSLIRLFSLTTLDLDLQRALPTVPNVNASATSYYPTALGSNDSQSFNPYRYSGTCDSSAFGFTPTPMVDTNASSTLLHTPSTVPHIPDNLTIGPSTSPLVSHCNCTELAITQDWPTVQEVAPSWGGTIKWPKGMSEAELRKEECRRLVWATVTLTATLNTYTSVIGDDRVTPLSIKNPRNYALMFPAESLAMTGTPVQANNMWTLYLRSMLLLQSCEQVRTDRNMCDADRAQFAMNAWLEIDAVESALDQHTCGLEAKSGFHAREMLFSARMCVSHEFQRYIPQVSTIGSKIFYRDQAERWLKQRMALADLIWASLKEGRYVQTLDRRKPLLIYWFVSHIIKALMLWRVDHTFTIALIASKAFVKCAEYLMVFWPSSEQRREWQKIRFELVEACLQTGVPPPETSIPIPFPRKEGAAAV
ncbi:hypothetical protein PYCCODRAFT_1435473 [Trametes coccinea BRFM310]|uniref:Zn(2)-C6 fungal-type domain-containing protein n=1 Tax=Trametes coccinea (strain BRFM310) TaxID=1353009 RepID=A0A1Y2IRB1_TRAC3|nr:hypothetical protein PYCCODRAFT_1435473 [Trametes coccinea BRFM310]